MSSFDSAAENEIVRLFAQVQSELESLCIRGLRSRTAEQTAWLTDARSRFEAMGASFLASEIQRFLTGLQSDDGQATRQLMRLLTVVRVFERLETLDAAAQSLERLAQGMEEAP